MSLSAVLSVILSYKMWFHQSHIEQFKHAQTLKVRMTSPRPIWWTCFFPNTRYTDRRSMQKLIRGHTRGQSPGTDTTKPPPHLSSVQAPPEASAALPGPKPATCDDPRHPPNAHQAARGSHRQQTSRDPASPREKTQRIPLVFSSFIQIHHETYTEWSLWTTQYHRWHLGVFGFFGFFRQLEAFLYTVDHGRRHWKDLNSVLCRFISRSNRTCHRMPYWHEIEH